MTPKTILLVEDNPDDLELAIRALRKGGQGEGVVVARDGVLFRYGKYWYLCDDGVWFRGRTVRGPFLHVGFSTVPRSVVLVPETYRRHWRESPGRGHAYGHYKNQRPEEVVVVKDRGHKGRGRDR